MSNTIAMTSLIAAVFIPLVFTGVAAGLRKRQFGHVDAHHPRIQQAQATGPAARAGGAAANGWEALATFAPAVVLAASTSPSSGLATIFALAWIPVRLAHGVAYIADVPPLRTFLFAIGVACALGLYLVGGGVL